MDSNLLEKYARTLIQYSLSVKKGDLVVIQGYKEAMPLIELCYREVLNAGAHPHVLMRHQLDEILLKVGRDDQLSFENPISEAVIMNADKILNIGGSSNTKYLSGVEPKRIAYYRKSGKRLNELYMNRVDNNELDWTLCMFPTDSLAQEAGMSLRDYEDFVAGACLLKDEDPVLAWKEVSKNQEKAIEYLKDKETIRIVSRDTDVSMKVGGRVWINSDGRTNFPSGEVFTGPVEDSVEGKIRFSFPGIYAGQEIEDIKLVFKKGKVIEASASKGEELLRELINTDEGASMVGEVAIGTNYGIDRFTKNMLYDEKMGGTVHMALGKSYGKSGGKNISAIHWDMLCDMKEGGEIYADGELFYKNGNFML
ncbi:aminopeptidase [Alkalibacter saccharofermentans]|uniref:Leucyl aminopeptidase (Aminopeptidase T) n=1 Tax=Alkalibacter saccharofermentans DSM 14828 TaxID=1120975 RepID=A0A1M4VXW9_9FIRM|nr:aminopeptidase [Alkalibacter saccharofermentans]SHE73904.1 Leucyl aminopeptidase (aminopeptidase T) [Alkalibacter saccharofermentans DSM 14828]